jgi:hypothetical protein
MFSIKSNGDKAFIAEKKIVAVKRLTILKNEVMKRLTFHHLTSLFLHC